MEKSNWERGYSSGPIDKVFSLVIGVGVTGVSLKECTYLELQELLKVYWEGSGAIYEVRNIADP